MNSIHPSNTYTEEFRLLFREGEAELVRVVEEFRERLQDLSKAYQTLRDEGQNGWEINNQTLVDLARSCQLSFRRKLIRNLGITQGNTSDLSPAFAEEMIGATVLNFPSAPLVLRGERVAVASGICAFVGMLMLLPLRSLFPAPELQILTYLSGALGAAIGALVTSGRLSSKMKKAFTSAGMIVDESFTVPTFLEKWPSIVSSLHTSSNSTRWTWLWTSVVVGLNFFRCWARSPLINAEDRRHSLEICVQQFEENLKSDLQAIALFRASLLKPVPKLEPEEDLLKQIKTELTVALRNADKIDAGEILDDLASKLGIELTSNEGKSPSELVWSADMLSFYRPLGSLEEGQPVRVVRRPVTEKKSNGEIAVITKGEVIGIRGRH
jgi:hypothetical protein